jgi:hypothetical protein
VPLKETVRPVATVRMPFAPPTDPGENLSVIVQVAAAVPQVVFVVSMINPAPVTVGLTTTGAPVLVTVTICPVLVSP